MERGTPLGTRWDDTYVSEWDGCAVMPDGTDETSSTQQNIQPWHGRRVGCAEGFAVERTEAMEASFTLFNLS